MYKSNAERPIIERNRKLNNSVIKSDYKEQSGIRRKGPVDELLS